MGKPVASFNFQSASIVVDVGNRNHFDTVTCNLPYMSKDPFPDKIDLTLSFLIFGKPCYFHSSL